MALSKGTLAALYRRRADWYDVSANAYYLIGMREATYRRMAVQALRLHPGDTVVERRNNPLPYKTALANQIDSRPVALSC